VRHWLVVPAAGAGQRFGAGLPKQYLEVAGRRLIEWAIDAFLERAGLLGIRVALAVDDPHWPRLDLSRRGEVAACAGGGLRSDSVLEALRSLEREARADDWILVHDAARPCVTRVDVERLLDAVRDDAVGGLLATPLADTLKRADPDQRSASTVEREHLWRALTPQVFRYELLREALESASQLNVDVTDEAAAVERLNLRPVLVAGRADNIKVTHREDLELAAAILTSRQRQ